MNFSSNILVVDDFRPMRSMIKNSLNQLGYQNISEAENGNDALDVLNMQRIDLVISDWNMPVMSGIELLKAVRANEKIKKTPFILVTAEANKDNVVESLKAGVNYYIVKPFTVDILKRRLELIR